ncbi:MAG: MmgE/PrpD family protein [Microlunatus sp.]
MDHQLSQRLARHVRSGAGSEDVELTAWMRLLLLDYYTVAAGGADLGSTLAARGAVRILAEPSPGALSTVVGGGFAAADEAAFVNGVAAHGLDLDDTYEPASLHPGAVVFPAAIAVAEAEGRSTQDLLMAAAAGYDVTCALGLLLGARESYARGFHPTGVVGTVGAAAAAARLLELDENRLAHALGLAATMAAGSLEFLADGSWTKRLNAGQAAANGVRAARLAAAGFTAPATAFEGRDGFLRLYGAGPVEDRDLELPDRFGQGAVATSVKFYPCCRYMHGNIDLLRQVHDEFPGLRPEDVESVEVGVIKAGATLVADPPEHKLIISSTVDAQFSMPFAAAVAIATGTATVPQFAEAPTVARELAGWLSKVRCVSSDALEAAFPQSWQAELRVILTDGRVIEKSEAAFRGAPGDPATLDMVRDKAADLIGTEVAEQLSAHTSLADLAAPYRGWQLA